MSGVAGGFFVAGAAGGAGSGSVTSQEMSVADAALSVRVDTQSQSVSVLSQAVSVISQQVSILSQTVSVHSQRWSTLAGGAVSTYLRKNAAGDFAWEWGSVTAGGVGSVTSAQRDALSNAISILSVQTGLIEGRETELVWEQILAGENVVVTPLAGGKAVEVSVSVTSNEVSAVSAQAASAINVVSQAVSVLSQATSVAYAALSVRIDTQSQSISVLSQAVSVISQQVSALSQAHSALSQAHSVLSQAVSVADAALSVRIDTQSQSISVLSQGISVISQQLSVLSQAHSVLSQAHSALSQVVSVISTTLSNLGSVVTVTMSNTLSVHSQAISVLSQQVSVISQQVSVISQKVSTLQAPTITIASNSQIISTATLTNVSGLSLSVSAGGIYEMYATLLYTLETTDAPVRFGLTFPAMARAGGQIQGFLSLNAPDSLVSIRTAKVAFNEDDSGVTLYSAAGGTAASTMPAGYYGLFVVSATGVVQIQAAGSTTTGAIHIERGSFIKMFQIG